MNFVTQPKWQSAIGRFSESENFQWEDSDKFGYRLDTKIQKYHHHFIILSYSSKPTIQI
jgi:hypothetical protein